MPARYSQGSKVKVKTREGRRTALLEVVEKYENLTGTVVSSRGVVAFLLQSFAEDNNQPTTLYMYTVELEDGATLYDVTEHHLEGV